MTGITELAQRNELLIANGQQIADLLRHLADNEIDSDYFAVVSECESYGKETDAELSITEFALRAAGYVDALVEALEKAQQQIIELQQGCENDPHVHEIIDLKERIAELEESHAQVIHARDHYKALWRESLKGARNVTVKPMRPGHITVGGEKIGIYLRDDVDEFMAELTAAGIKVEAE
ncbi:TPA: hypothetical protein QHM55_001721 [Klebsiella aerogenes]|nr:hypothetical protein [Klebsiella aerogenes]